MVTYKAAQDAFRGSEKCLILIHHCHSFIATTGVCLKSRAVQNAILIFKAFLGRFLLKIQLPVFRFEDVITIEKANFLLELVLKFAVGSFVFITQATAGGVSGCVGFF